MHGIPAILTLLASFLPALHTAKVLFIPVMLRSHVMEMAAIGEELVTRGHQVHMILGHTYPSLDSLTSVGIQPLLFNVKPDEMMIYSKDFDVIIREHVFGKMSVEEFNRHVMSSTFKHCNRTVKDPEILTKVRDIGFDLAVVDGLTFTPCTFLLPHILRIPYVYQCSLGPPWSLGVPALPSFVPFDYFKFSDKMTLTQRIQNLVHFVKLEYYNPLDFFEEAQGEGTVHGLMQDHGVGHWNMILKDCVLVIVTRDHHLEFPMPSMPRVIRTPGLTQRPPKPLPDNLNSVIEKKSHGVILASFGSTLSGLPDALLLKLCQAFEAFPEYTVIMRQDGKPKDIAVPSNVHLSQWMPQNDILGHPKTKLFITHGGNNGRYEAAYHGVPMIVFPVYAEQPHNALYIAEKKLGLEMNIRHFATEDLINNISYILNNPVYYKNTARLSAMLHDQPLPKETITFWLEHVITYGGGHLMSSVQDMPLYQIFMLDIVALFILLCLASLILIFAICVLMWIYCCRTPMKVKIE